MKVLVTLVAVVAAIGCAKAAQAGCLPVQDDASLAINTAAAANFKRDLGIDRAALFATLNEISQIETSGCWAAPAGDFDGQIVSIGTAQWNYGQESLQPILKRYRSHFLTQAAFDANLQDVMPEFGATVFSTGCLAVSKPVSGSKKRVGGMSQECQQFFRDHQHGGKLDGPLNDELEALFNSKTMRQVQIDTFVDLVGRVRSDLVRLFPGRRPSPAQIQWAIDTKVQQDTFPSNSSLERVRADIAAATPAKLKSEELGIVNWYSGLCASGDQGGVKYDVGYNVREWNKLILDGRLTPEQVELMKFTFLRSRTASGLDGYWQALTFERRIKIAFGVGSVAGNTKVRGRSIQKG